MDVGLLGAKTISSLSTWFLKNIFRRPAANFPGKVALYVEPRVIEKLSSKLEKGSIVVCGTNGKTTVTNLLADTIEVYGNKVICNRTGANLDSGVATALLHGKPSDWGVFECDELWVAKVLPQLEAKYLLLLNLFRDQLDRVGEIQLVQDSIVSALEASPHTTLVYNADDPLCAAIADRVPRKSVAFGLDEPLKLEQSSVIDAQMCHRCEGMLRYRYRQYGQLGNYFCPSCEFSRPNLDFYAQEPRLGTETLDFEFVNSGKPTMHVEAPYSGAYMLYNLVAVASMSQLAGCSCESFKKALKSFNPQNGRLEHFCIQGHDTLLNLAKNPTGFNQNLELVLQDNGPKIVVFSVNDKEGDGRDVSWLWDVSFERLQHEHLQVFASGLRRNDLQVRLKYAGIKAPLIDAASDAFSLATSSEDAHFYFIANYTALPVVRAELLSLVSQNRENASSKEKGGLK